ncbi:MAG: hypothetical protein H7281_07150 [Bacteriovorax sp.]|nr:hypothetical protein [Bacteriovorax sp.]
MINFKILYLVIASTVALSFNARAENCVELTNRIIKTDRLEILNTDLPKKLRLKHLPDTTAILELHEDIAMKIFQQARENFTKIINQKNTKNESLKDILASLKNGEIKELKHSDLMKDDLIENLKAIRKQAIILRSVFEVYSKDHTSPEQFEKFTKSLGKLNDYLDFNAWKAVPDGAKKVVKSLNLEEINHEFNAFVASTPKATKEHLDEIKIQILEHLKKEKLNVDEFHETRKMLKHFLAVAQLMKDRTDKRQNLESTFKFLEELNDKLGSLRDDVLEKEINAVNNGKKLDFKDEGYQQIPDNFKEAIRVFIKNFKIVAE